MAFAALTIDITAKLANLESGLQKASGQLDGFAAKAERVSAGLATAFGAIAGAFAIDAVISKIGATVNQLADLDDAAESTGASVESLSSLLNTLAPTGVTLEQISDAAGKLAKSMAGADEESSRAAETFKAIGVATKDASGNLRGVDDVLVDVAKALAGYDDSTNKTVIAQALFGKSGGALLPMLKDLATRQREAATVTTESAAEAERLSNAWRSIQRDGELVAQSIAAKIIPALANLAEQFVVTGKAGGSLYDQIRGVLGPNKYAGQLQNDLTALQKKRDELASDARPLMQIGKAENLKKIEDQIADTRRRLEVIRGAQRITGTVQDQFDGVTPGGTGSAGQAPRISSFDTPKAGRPDRVYAELDAVIRQAEADEVLRAEAAAAKDLARELDRAADAQLRRTVEYDRAAAADADADTAIERDVEAIKNAIDPTRQLYKELERVRELTAAGILPQDVGNARQAQILGKVDEVLSPVPNKIKETDDAARQLGLTFSSAFEDAVVGGKKASEVLQGIGQDIARIFIRKSITEPLAGFAATAFKGLLGFANGGDPPVGVPSIVGERGPELFVPKQRGTIVPSGRFGMGGGAGPMSFTLNVASGVTRQELLQAGQAFMAEAQVRILQSMRGGGAFA
jgi:hypothetical protein